MRYIGGKNRIAKELAPILLASEPAVVVEPFCGALNITLALIKLRPEVTVYASDSHYDLIQMWQAVQDGWSPPSELTRAAYDALKNETASSPLRTFAGYGCSFSGKWFGGFAADGTGRNYCANARNSIEKARPLLENVVFSCRNYNACVIPANSIVYCDPPYADTTKPGVRGVFDHPAFWEWAVSLPVECFVSEYTASEGTRIVWEKLVKTDMATKSGKGVRTEKLFKTGIL